ncbi:MAG: LysE family transporter [Nitrososphaerota archaeon]|nr:LysE family translocator [Candidatus Bathyarchaeota archaeon]MDW8022335.1 LysE family transporter [Nitrososphaerota archaeon]
MLEVLALLLLGFTVGLSGAVIPGPLLAFVIFDSARKRKVTGQFIIAGHALWEALIIFLILFGLGGVMLQYKLFIYIIGGGVMILMGVLMVKGKDEVKIESSKVNSSMLGGVFYTAFNPTQPPWWASAGLALLLQGYELIGNIGVLTVTIGHWLADLAYYTLISYLICRYGRFIIPKQRWIKLALGLFVALLGVYFIMNGVLGC